MLDSPPEFHEADFHKSSLSDPNMECVHVARRGVWVALRDSKTAFDTRDDRWLVFTTDQFDAFLAQHWR